jgi:hypothetical protein
VASKKPQAHTASPESSVRRWTELAGGHAEVKVFYFVILSLVAL